ncbi:MAG TPA: hypothetical protein VEP90_08065, partial [Methylomirabilota bacterium]|nr:hypothetical protein [Methylomirabilota bacterium]
EIDVIWRQSFMTQPTLYIVVCMVLKTNEFSRDTCLSGPLNGMYKSCPLSSAMAQSFTQVELVSCLINQWLPK